MGQEHGDDSHAHGASAHDECVLVRRGAFALRHFPSSQLDGCPDGGAVSRLTYSPWGKFMSATYKDIGVSSEGHVGIVEIQRPPHNFFDNSLINQIADAFEAFDRDGNIRAYVLRAQGKSFCAGGRFAANFTRLGFHPGFSLTYTLPRLIGQQRANLMFYTGRRIGGEEAVAWGLADVLVPLADVRKGAMDLAKEIAESAPLALLSTRETMRRGFADGAEEATERELTEQDWTRKTEDFKEGVKSYAEKRVGNFKGR